MDDKLDRIDLFIKITREEALKFLVEWPELVAGQLADNLSIRVFGMSLSDSAKIYWTLCLVLLREFLERKYLILKFHSKENYLEFYNHQNHELRRHVAGELLASFINTIFGEENSVEIISKLMHEIREGLKIRDVAILPDSNCVN